MNGRQKVVVVQESIPHYRVPFFEKLGEVFDLTVIHSRENERREFLHFRPQYLPSRKWGPFKYQSGLFKHLKREQYDRVVFMFDIHWISTLYACLRLPPNTYALWGHRYSQSKIGNTIKNFFLRRTNRIILYSDCHRDALKSLGIDERKIFTAHNTMVVSNHSDTSDCAKDSFLFVGRAQLRKRIDVLLDGFAKAFPPDSPVRLNIVGDGEINQQLMQQAVDLGLGDRVRFWGEIIDDNKLKDLYSKAIAYVSPGPVGLSVLQSFGYGVPVITCVLGKHGPEFSNLKDRENARIYACHSEIEQILRDANENRQAFSELGRNAYSHFVGNRSIEQMCSAFVQAIR